MHQGFNCGKNKHTKNGSYSNRVDSNDHSLDAKVWFLFRTSQQLNKNNNKDQRIEFGYVGITLSEN